MPKLITAETPDGRVVREVEPNGFERAYRLNANRIPSRSIGHKGPWLLCPVEQVPAHIWAALTEEAKMNEIIRTDEEVSDLLDRINEIKRSTGTKFRGMSYEDGLCSMLYWLIGHEDEDPLT